MIPRSLGGALWAEDSYTSPRCPGKSWGNTSITSLKDSNQLRVSFCRSLVTLGWWASSCWSDWRSRWWRSSCCPHQLKRLRLTPSCWNESELWKQRAAVTETFLLPLKRSETSVWLTPARLTRSIDFTLTFRTARTLEPGMNDAFQGLMRSPNSCEQSETVCRLSVAH